MQADDSCRIPASVGARPVPAPLAGGDLGRWGFPHVGRGPWQPKSPVTRPNPSCGARFRVSGDERMANVDLSAKTPTTDSTEVTPTQ
jgi:hypothetical protein